MEIFVLNLRGRKFYVKRKGCREDCLEPSSPLLGLGKNSKYHCKDKDEYYFNRSAAVFDYVYDYLMTGNLHIPGNVCTERIREEMDFWGIPQCKVKKCCWKKFYETDEELDIIQKLLDQMPNKEIQHDPIPELISVRGCRGTRSWIFRILDKSTLPGKVWYSVICTAILVSTFLFVMISVPAFREEYDSGPYPYSIKTDILVMYWTTRPHPAILVLDGLCNLILMADWILRFINSPRKKTFIKNFFNAIEVISCLGQWNYIFVEYNRNLFAFTEGFVALMLGSIIYCTRIFRIFRLITDNCGVRILYLSIKSCSKELLLLAMFFLCVAIMFALLLYLAEISSTSDDVSFPNVLVAMWWAVITMTTVGYGDFYPTTIQGCCVGAFCAVMGILLIALPVAVTSSSFNDFYTFNKYRERYIKSMERNKGKNTFKE